MRVKLLLLLLAVAVAMPLPLHAAGPPPADDARAQALFRQLRCPVCEGESLAESSSQVAADMRRQIRVMLAQGDSDQAILTAMTAHYGEHILQNPPLRRSTLLLWLGPVLFLAAGLMMMLIYFRRSIRGAP